MGGLPGQDTGKILLMFGIFILTSIASFFPWYIQKLESANTILKLACAFAVGIVLGSALCHMLPDSNEKFLDYFELELEDDMTSATVTFPYASLISGATFFILVIIDRLFIDQHMMHADDMVLDHHHEHHEHHLHLDAEVCNEHYHHHHHEVHDMYTCTNLKPNTLGDSNSINRSVASTSIEDSNEYNTDLQGDVSQLISDEINSQNNINVTSINGASIIDVSDEKITKCGGTNNNESNSDYNGGIIPLNFELNLVNNEDKSKIFNMLDSAYKTDNDFDYKENILDEEINKDGFGCESKLLKRQLEAWTMFAALSVHSICDGLSIGSSNSVEELISMSIAVLAHKFFDGFTMGIPIFYAQFKLSISIILLLVFACTTPLGIGIGWVLQATAGTNLVTAIILSISTGTFLFISLFELLPYSLTGSKFLIYKCVLLLLGFGIMSLLALWV